jgi:hypothetical protein
MKSGLGPEKQPGPEAEARRLGVSLFSYGL